MTKTFEHFPLSFYYSPSLSFLAEAHQPQRFALSPRTALQPYQQFTLPTDSAFTSQTSALHFLPLSLPLLSLFS